VRHHSLQVAAALSYYFVLSIFPGLIFLSAVLGIIPVPDLFNDVLNFVARLLPHDSMHVVYSVLHDVLTAHRGTWLSFGMLGLIWMASSSYAALIEALDIAYDAEDNRPYWKTRLLAVALSAISGGLLLIALLVILVGPRFGEWLTLRLGLSTAFMFVWPAMRWIIAVGFAVVAVEALYFLAPNVKQRFKATLPGAFITVVVWDGLSYLLGIYFQHFAHFNRTYGTLAGLVAMMIWLYWTSFILLVGAELNAELAKESSKGSIESKDAEESHVPQTGADLDHAA
jgi:membrane protein